MTSRRTSRTTPRALFTTLAKAEAVTWTLLIIGMVLKYVTHTTQLGVRIGGALHGFVFLAYCLVTLLVATDARWRVGTTLTALASAVPPWATLWFERKAEREGLLADEWRLRREPPTNAAEPIAATAAEPIAAAAAEPIAATPAERACAWLLAHPVLAAVLGVVAVCLLFGVALVIGPPVPGKH